MMDTQSPRSLARVLCQPTKKLKISEEPQVERVGYGNQVYMPEACQGVGILGTPSALF